MAVTRAGNRPTLPARGVGGRKVVRPTEPGLQVG